MEEHSVETKPTTWEFRYRTYQKRSVIQLKPFHDKENHFSIIWTKGKAQGKGLSKDQFDEIDNQIRNFIHAKGDRLVFTILRACTNCTYGRFDDDFEKLILDLREKYPEICHDKDLTLDDPKHVDLHDKVLWNEKNPIFHHIHGRSETGTEHDKNWELLFRGPLRADQIQDGMLFMTKVECLIKFE
jgi:hypothetical protein